MQVDALSATILLTGEDPIRTETEMMHSNVLSREVALQQWLQKNPVESHEAPTGFLHHSSRPQGLRIWFTLRCM
jgi:hypothetical protein